MARCCRAPQVIVSKFRHVEECTTGGWPGGFSIDGIRGYHTIPAHTVAVEVTCLACGTVNRVPSTKDQSIQKPGGYCAEIFTDENGTSRRCNGPYGHGSEMPHGDRYPS